MNRTELISYEDFRNLLAERHEIGPDLGFNIWYTDPADNDLLPINNDNNLARAISAAKPLLRIHIQRKGNSSFYINVKININVIDVNCF